MPTPPNIAITSRVPAGCQQGASRVKTDPQVGVVALTGDSQITPSMLWGTPDTMLEHLHFRHARLAGES